MTSFGFQETLRPSVIHECAALFHHTQNVFVRRIKAAGQSADRGLRKLPTYFRTSSISRFFAATWPICPLWARRAGNSVLSQAALAQSSVPDSIDRSPNSRGRQNHFGIRQTRSRRLRQFGARARSLARWLCEFPSTSPSSSTGHAASKSQSL